MSLLQEALKRKEHDEAQSKPEAGSAEKVPAALSPADVNLSTAGQQAAEVKNTGIPPDSPLQSMPALAPPQSAASQPILAPRSAIALRDGESAEPSRLGGAFSPRQSLWRSLGGEAWVAKPGRRKASLLWVIVAVIAILTGLTVVAGFVFFIYRGLPPVKAKISQQANQIGKMDTTAAGGTNIVIAQPVPADRRETADSAEATPHQFAAPDVKNAEKEIVTAARTQTVAIMQNAELNAVRQQSAGDTERKPVSAKPTPVRAKTPTASSSAVRWPMLKLTGILRGSGPAESTALINGKMISAGQTIDDVIVVEIQADGVLLKHGAEKRFLRVGATLY